MPLRIAAAAACLLFGAEVLPATVRNLCLGMADAGSTYEVGQALLQEDADVAGVRPTASEASAGNLPPRIETPASPEFLKGESISFPIVFSTAVANFNDASKVQVLGGLAHSGVTIKNLDGYGYSNRWEVTISGVTGSGEIGLRILAEAAEDDRGNKNSRTDFPNLAIVDNVAPAIESITRAMGPPASYGELSFDIQFNEQVSSFDGSGLQISAPGVRYTMPQVALVGEAPSSLARVTLYNVTGSGTIFMGLQPDMALDRAGNGNKAFALTRVQSVRMVFGVVRGGFAKAPVTRLGSSTGLHAGLPVHFPAYNRCLTDKN